MILPRLVLLIAFPLLLISCTEPRLGGKLHDVETSTIFSPPVTKSSESRDIDMDEGLSPIETLGKRLFFDTNLSEPNGQSCASCHSPSTGFAEPDSNLPVSEGVLPGNFGGRNALSASYVKFTPLFDLGAAVGDAIGGFFWDGRKISLEEQAKAPFLNPLEMNNPSLETVVADVMIADYSPLFLEVFGLTAFDDPVQAYEFIAEAIAAYERSHELNSFTSKYDHFRSNLTSLSTEEMMGLELFTGKAKCAHCHLLNSETDPMLNDLFTNFKYANIGLGKNPNFPFDLMPPDTVDLGLGAITGDLGHNGKFKTPHLRNIALTPPYMHNGLFDTLEEVVHFYNTRDVHPHVIPPEVTENMVFGNVGDLGLTDMEIEAIVEFLDTLSDGWEVFPVKPDPVTVVVNDEDDEEDEGD